ncbi:MAG TPA: hypothetical protein PKY82_14515 [Pyrinomonadaceae bacterium]|nr:hypothetical protein [Pyrinomonadaceae bacterium]
MKTRVFITIQIVLLIGFLITAAFAQEKVIFDNWNVYTVYNNPTSNTTFTIKQVQIVTTIINYHWNNGRGATPGTIAIKDSTGNIYGPWNTKGSPGQGGVPNAIWTAYPNAKLPAGTYTVIDSDPQTWARNSSSGNSGFSKILGNSPMPQRELIAIVENQSNVNVLIWQDGYAPRDMQDVLKYHLEPGWKSSLKVKITANGQIKFIAGSGGASETGQFNKVIGSCMWADDPSNNGRIPYVIFDSSKQLVCRDGKK